MSGNYSFRNVSAFNKPYQFGYAAPQADGALLWDYWNGPTDAARVASLEARGLWRVGSGSAELPSLSFVDEPDSGFYRAAANRVGLALGGAKVGEFRSDQFDVPGIKVNNVIYPGSLASGDLLYGSAAHTLTRLVKGAEGTVLKMGAEFPEWGEAASGGIGPEEVGDGLELFGGDLRVKLADPTLERSAAGLRVLSAPTVPWSGITGAPNLFNRRGAFVMRTAYAIGDVVTYNAHLFYVAVAVPASNTDAPVDGNTWVQLSADPTAFASQNEVNAALLTEKAVSPATLGVRLSSFFQ